MTVLVLILLALSTAAMALVALRVRRSVPGSLMPLSELGWTFGALFLSAVMLIVAVTIAPERLLRPIGCYFVGFIISLGGVLAIVHYRSRRKGDPYE